MIKPYYEDEAVTIYHGDCREVLPHLQHFDAVIGDPPYGVEWEGNQRFSGGNTRRGKGTRHAAIIGDDEPFDPSPWLGFACPVVLWGANHFWGKLPSGAALVWQKRNDDALGTFLSDAEIAYMNVGVGVYVFVKVFAGSSRAIDGSVGAYKGSLHPNQKPVSLMTWCMTRAKIPFDATVLDPYMGSASTGIACIRTGRKFIGIDKDLQHVKTAVERIRVETRRGVLRFA